MVVVVVMVVVEGEVGLKCVYQATLSLTIKPRVTILVLLASMCP